jgi:putative pyoverdin transport system ATP-binding/permease protein
MSLLRFIARESGAEVYRILYAAIVSGLANGLFIAIINAGSIQAANDRLDVRLIAAGLLAIVLYGVLQHYALGQAAAAAETALLRVRLRVMGKLPRCQLRFIETQGDIGTFLPLSEDAGLISQGALSLAAAAQGLLVVVFAALYLAWLSPVTLIVAMLVYAVMLPLVAERQQQARRGLGGAAAADARFYQRFAGLLAGFKELKLNRQENDALFADIRRGTRWAFRLKLDSSTRMVQSVALGYAVPVLVVFAGVFLVPALTPEAGTTVHEVTMTVLFMSAPLGVLVGAAPMLARIDAALSRIERLEREVEQGSDPADAGAAPQDADRDLACGVAAAGFERIELRDIGFRYLDRDGQPLFAVGPIDLEVHAGELLFIVGGNGAGKSTLLKLLTGLYPPDQGELRLDGRLLQPGDLPRYRALFATVFTDFNLSRRLYGIPRLEPDAVNGWLRELEIADKTRYTEQGFTNLDLSTGQKKRLAIVAAILKGRPICVLDEPAADQDPAFRRRLYEELLPRLRAAGRTLIVVSHDDRYFNVADRVLEMRDGELKARNGA